MSDLLYTLYAYTIEHRIDRYLNEEQEYRDSVKYSAQRLDWLNSRLSEEEKTALEDYADMLNTAQAILQECLFRAALGLGFELNRA